MYAGRLEPSSLILWMLLVGVSVVPAVLAARPADGADPRTRTFGPLLALVVPVSALALTLWAFTISEAHPLLQYNDGEARRGAFDLWGSLWPVLLLGGLAGVLICFVRLVAARTRQLRIPGVWLLAMAANAVTVACLFVNFPSV